MYGGGPLHDDDNLSWLSDEKDDSGIPYPIRVVIGFVVILGACWLILQIFLILIGK